MLLPVLQQNKKFKFVVNSFGRHISMLKQVRIIEMFKKFPSGVGRTKKDYYDYIDLVLNNAEQDDDNDYILGNFGGAFAEPGAYSNKKPLEFYKDLLFSIQDPSQNQDLQAQDVENTEKSKQIGTLGINNVK